MFLYKEDWQNFDLFFQDPSTKREGERCGMLYLLRRDISSCLSCLRVDLKTGELKILVQPIIWPAAMLVMAGIDLLGKFLAGDDETRGGAVGIRFRDFICKYFDTINTDDAKTVYQLRNSLLHSFGLFSTTNNKEYRFTVKYEGDRLVTEGIENKYLIDLKTLREQFDAAVKKYRKDLIEKPDLQENFIKMYGKYGETKIG